MNFRDYKHYLMSVTKGNIPHSVVKGWKRNWKIYRKIMTEESQPPRDPSDIIFGTVR